MKERIFNFSPGPAMLPVAVLERVRDSILNYADSGMGILELSHRGPEFKDIIERTEANMRALLGVSSDYTVLFLQGGATLQFSMVPMNLLKSKHQGNYLISGIWAQKAYEEAGKFGQVHVAGSSEAQGFNSLPATINLSKRPAYLHFTSNNTIYGTQYKTEPESGDVPLICDASSDLLHRELDINKYGLIYAGAQKNLGPAGVTVVVIRNDLLKRSPTELPIMLDYNTHATKKSLYNTPTTFGIYVIGEVLDWIKNEGGLSEIAKRNQRKAEILYSAIDASDFYHGTASNTARSCMNVTFQLKDRNLEEKFIEEAATVGLVQLKGHRSVGGLRASIYNGFPIDGVMALVGFMEHFAKQNG